MSVSMSVGTRALACLRVCVRGRGVRASEWGFKAMYERAWGAMEQARYAYLGHWLLNSHDAEFDAAEFGLLLLREHDLQTVIIYWVRPVYVPCACPTAR